MDFHLWSFLLPPETITAAFFVMPPGEVLYESIRFNSWSFKSERRKNEKTTGYVHGQFHRHDGGVI